MARPLPRPYPDFFLVFLLIPVHLRSAPVRLSHAAPQVPVLSTCHSLLLPSQNPTPNLSISASFWAASSPCAPLESESMNYGLAERAERAMAASATAVLTARCTRWSLAGCMLDTLAYLVGRNSKVFGCWTFGFPPLANGFCTKVVLPSTSAIGIGLKEVDKPSCEVQCICC